VEPCKNTRSVTADIDHSLDNGLRGFLSQIVPDAALDDPVRIFAREFLSIGTGVRMWCTVGIRRQWCSVATCGNRHRVAEFRRRQSEARQSISAG